MKIKSFWTLVLFFVALSIITFSCKKDKNSASNEPEPEVYYEEPENPVIVNLLNDEGSYVVILGCYVKISEANNFYRINNNNHYLSFCNVGEVENLGYVYQVPQDGWSDQVAVIPGNGYILKDYENDNYGLNNIKYARIYVVDYIYNSSNEIIGAQIVYQDKWCYQPMVDIYNVQEVTNTSAVCKGFVRFPDNTITSKGFCWSKTNYYPTVEDNVATTNGDNDGFMLELNGLEAGTEYRVRAFIESRRFGVLYSIMVEFKTLENPSVATVKTLLLANITETSASCFGSVVNDNGGTVSERGICWDTSPNPTIEGNHQPSDMEINNFHVNITGLTPETTYYVRAYATNEYGIAYGDVLSFKTTAQGPTGSINGQFTVGADKRVYFSGGNLQYKTSTNEWSFAESQTYYLGHTDEYLNYIKYQMDYEHIELFGWGTGNNPTNTSTDDDDYSTFTDWGINPISNGGDPANSWRTLTSDEWDYLLNTRYTLTGIRYAKANINSVFGLMLLPDDWNNIAVVNNANTPMGSYMDNAISDADWLENYEARGAVFLPTAGHRVGTEVDNYHRDGFYWTSPANNNSSSFLLFGYNDCRCILNANARHCGYSVRLVSDAN